jgi:ribonuclease BN (tRNA processing enzyme)
MKVIILCSSGATQYVSSYLINRTVAIDAGCLGFCGSPEEQMAVRNVLLTHAHADHIASLPSFLDNVWTPASNCPTLYGSAATLETVRRCLLNDEVWPDLVALSERMSPFVRLRTIEPEVPVDVDGLMINPVAVNHTIPTVGYIVHDGESAVIFAGDSGPTDRLWEIAHNTTGLRAVFLECSFPNRMRAVAEASCHLTPERFARETAKIPAGVRIIAVHLKVRYCNEIASELHALRIAKLEIGQCNVGYTF